MNILLFAKAEGVPDTRIAEFQIGKLGRTGTYNHVWVRELIGVTHEPCSDAFDAVLLNLAHLLAAGITELRLEVEA